MSFFANLPDFSAENRFAKKSCRIHRIFAKNTAGYGAVAVVAPMKRGLKLLAFLLGDLRQFVAVVAPMKRGLKLRAPPRLLRIPAVAVVAPMKRGLKRQLRMELRDGKSGCSCCPYEEGIETDVSGRPPFCPIEVAVVAPMKRGLKLLITTKGIKHPKGCSCCPYEEGIETFITSGGAFPSM